MSSPSSPTIDGDPLSAAVSADRSLWDPSDARPQRWLEIRNAAVRDAVAAGYTTADIAAALGVLPSDVDRIVRG